MIVQCHTRSRVWPFQRSLNHFQEELWETGCVVLSLAVDKHVTSPHTLSGVFALTMPLRAP